MLTEDQVFLAATNSNAGTVYMVTIPLILSVCMSFNALAAASRQAWMLSRNQALPFSQSLHKVISARLQHRSHIRADFPTPDRYHWDTCSS